MENLKQTDHQRTEHQRLLHALESLSISIGFVSTAVEMVHDELWNAFLAPQIEMVSVLGNSDIEIVTDPTQQRFDFDAF